MLQRSVPSGRRPDQQFRLATWGQAVVKDCALCTRPVPDQAPFGDAQVFDCPVCSHYVVSGSFLASTMKQLSPKQRGLLSIIVRTRPDTRGEPVVLHHGSVPGLLNSYTQPAVPVRRQLVLEYFLTQSDDVGAMVDVELMWNDYPTFHCTSPEALEWVIESLVATKQLAQHRQNVYSVTPSGWEAASPKGGVPGTCFVAMSFDPHLDAASKAIERAVESAGLKPLRVDRVEHNRNINDFIMAEIRRAEVLIADFTMHKAGVYFEAGFALGLNREVVYSCRKDDFGNAHFDTKPYNHIIWTDEVDLEQRLRARLLNTVPSLIGWR